ncbi:MAG: glycosyltransferase [Proteobacteria bacterium]|nr:glycosyltransferase [Pseudomonadota bacterium]
MIALLYIGCKYHGSSATWSGSWACGRAHDQQHTDTQKVLVQFRVLMLGWEYPPHISGGLGTACEGLSLALSRREAEVLFVIPHLVGGETASHMTLVDSLGNDAAIEEGEFYRAEGGGKWDRSRSIATTSRGAARTVRVPAALKPYWRPSDFEAYKSRLMTEWEQIALAGSPSSLEVGPQGIGFAHYGRDIFEEVDRYAVNVLSLFREEEFDLIHAHDWMTFPAGIAMARVTGKPLVLHVHSLEFDRSGDNVNSRIAAIERWGLNAADAVIAVSYYTRSLIQTQYQVAEERLHVVHNGVYPRRPSNIDVPQGIEHRRIVLFLGRITFQKGPDYFVEAAAKVIPHVPDALFVMAGSGDMLERMIHRAHELGIQDHFKFPGFLRGVEVEQMFSLASLYVMPSVSEPFGISALEAISHETPVILSRQSGVSEVLKHVLKVDFWDIDRMADLIINALLHKELREDMVAMAREEIRKLRWDASAVRTLDVYRSVV